MAEEARSRSARAVTMRAQSQCARSVSARVVSGRAQAQDACRCAQAEEVRAG